MVSVLPLNVGVFEVRRSRRGKQFEILHLQYFIAFIALSLLQTNSFHKTGERV